MNRWSKISVNDNLPLLQRPLNKNLTKIQMTNGLFQNKTYFEKFIFYLQNELSAL